MEKKEFDFFKQWSCVKTKILELEKEIKFQNLWIKKMEINYLISNVLTNFLVMFLNETQLINFYEIEFLEKFKYIKIKDIFYEQFIDEINLKSKEFLLVKLKEFCQDKINFDLTKIILFNQKFHQKLICISKIKELKIELEQILNCDNYKLINQMDDLKKINFNQENFLNLIEFLQFKIKNF